MKMYILDIPQYKWQCYCYLDTEDLNAAEILGRLWQIGCPYKDIRNAKESLEMGAIDTGLTYSNYAERTSVMVIGHASEPREFYNSVAHESQHLASHIAQEFAINPWGERMAYLVGDIAMSLWPKIKGYLCDCHRYGD